MCEVKYERFVGYKNPAALQCLFIVMLLQALVLVTVAACNDLRRDHRTFDKLSLTDFSRRIQQQAAGLQLYSSDF